MMKSFEKANSDIFISYRRSDGAAFAEGLTNSLKTSGYNVFFDKKSLSIGTSFPSAIDEAIKNAKEIIIIVSPDYFGIESNGKRRLFEKNDWVRLELQKILKNKSTNIFPVLIDCAPPSKADLPYGLKSLTSLNYVRFNKSFDTYEKIVEKIVPQFHDETCENARIGIIAEKIRSVDVYDNLQFNIACKNIIDYLEDTHGQNAMKHIISAKNNGSFIYPESHRFIVFYTLFSYYRRMHLALQLLDLVDTYGQTFLKFPFTEYVFMEYYQTKYNLESDSIKCIKYLKSSLKHAKNGITLLPNNNGIIHSYCLAVALAGENGISINKEDSKLADKMINNIINTDPEYALYHCTKARLLANEKNYETALIQLKIAQTLEKPEHNDWILRIANYYRVETTIRLKMINDLLNDSF